MINTKLQNIIDTKSAIGNAIVNKGGTITGETPFFNYAAQIDGISTGTPQTIFQASDGSKWALTNAVNLTNVSNNVTSDFNYWQPANNSTSDPILNVGTVGANISGNIRLVPVDQVNISQYVNIVATDTLGGKYVGFNGFDQITNPTPTGNTTFNRWLLNNSATGTVIFANATFTTGIYNGANASSNEANLPFVNNTASYGATIETVTTNNGFIYVGGQTNRTIQKFHQSNLAFVGNSPSYGFDIFSLTVNNGFIYAGGAGNSTAGRDVKKYYESNLAFVGNTVNYGGDIFSLTTNNGFIYVGGSTNQTVQKFNESNLVRVGNTVSYVGEIFSVTVNNGFIYAVGQTNQTVQKFNESNLVRVGNTVSYGGAIRTIAINNGFIYVGGGTFGQTNLTVQKFYEDNLSFVGNTAGYGDRIQTVTTNNGFIYAGGFSETNIGIDGTVQKFYESNLAFVSNTANYGGGIRSITTNNGFIYAGGDTNRTVKKFQEAGLIPDNQTFYTATKIKE
jgi:hypothetical protein